MNEDRKRLVDNKGIEWGYRGIVFLVLIAQLWLSSHYVTREEYKEYMEQNENRIRKVEDAILRMTTQQALAEIQRSQIIDHEARLRSLENRPQSYAH